MAKEILCGFGVDVDAVAGWLGSDGGEDLPGDTSRRPQRSSMGRKAQAAAPPAVARASKNNALPLMERQKDLGGPACSTSGSLPAMVRIKERPSL